MQFLRNICKFSQTLAYNFERQNIIQHKTYPPISKEMTQIWPPQPQITHTDVSIDISQCKKKFAWNHQHIFYIHTLYILTYILHTYIVHSYIYNIHVKLYILAINIIYPHIHVCAYIYVYICIYIYVYMYIYICVCVCVYTNGQNSVISPRRWHQPDSDLIVLFNIELFCPRKK